MAAAALTDRYAANLHGVLSCYDRIIVTGTLPGAFKKALIERALGAELSHHLGYPPGSDKPEEASNHRNGASGKTVLTEDGPVRIEVPKDREGSFETLLIPKHERRWWSSGCAPADTSKKPLRMPSACRIRGLRRPWQPCGRSGMYPIRS